jgi:hypothetical protein
MTEEPMTGPEPAQPEPAQPERGVDAGPSTDLVLPAPQPVVRPVRLRASLAVRVRRQLELLRQNPAAMAAVATVGSAVATAALRRTLPRTSLSPARKSTPIAIGGYVVHEVHVVHHVVHHVIRPPAGQ